MDVRGWLLAGREGSAHTEGVDGFGGRGADDGRDMPPADPAYLGNYCGSHHNSDPLHQDQARPPGVRPRPANLLTHILPVGGDASAALVFFLDEYTGDDVHV